MKIQALLLATPLLFVSAQAAVVAEWNFSTNVNFEGWDTVSLNVTGLGVSAGNSFRVDPIGGASSNSNSQTQGKLFEVDFIQVTSVPEPGAALLGGLGSIGLLRRSR
jgi:hypothetical protein